MATMELLFNLSGINLTKFKNTERILLESYFVVCIYQKIYEKFYITHQKSLREIKLHTRKEDTMMDNDFLLYLINDILSTEEYSLIGIANYIRVPEDVIYDLVSGVHKNPSMTLWKKIIELHSIVRQELYVSLINKVISHQSDNTEFK